MSKAEEVNATDVAIVGMTCRFPGARNVDQFWQNLCNGVESISFFSDQELEQAGVDRAQLENPNFVKAGSMLEDVDKFDASFFEFAAREAEVTDPQHRVLLECAWEALESAGYDPERFKGRIGVYAGAGMNMYLLNLVSNPALLKSVGAFQIQIGNDKDYLATRISYKLNLKGPSVSVQTACSSSLVAVSFACQSLLDYQCDMALAGGISIRVPQKTGYLFQPGSIASPDGHCRAFDAKAQGTVFGSGAGIVVLKRLKDALADCDYIHAVIKGSAINNDGSSKIGYTAPSVDGQVSVIAEALSLADVESDSITYIEAHGTGTPLGDPIEIAALNKVFRAGTQKKHFCAIGSVKSNFGHLDAAAGIAGLIKTVQSLEHKLLPPSLHFEHPNPEIDFDDSPFYVSETLAEWGNGRGPRRAGVSSFGIGGTNAHIIVEEAPAVTRAKDSRPYQLLLLSAKTGAALEKATGNLLKHLREHRELDLADVAFTLQLGRRAFNHRRALVCRSLDDAIEALEQREAGRVRSHSGEAGVRPVVFMFPGQGAQYINMGLELYQLEPTFREQVDLCSKLAEPYLGLDLRELMYPQPGHSAGPSEVQEHQLRETRIAQPALFVIEYALAKLYERFGIHPEAMVGHSIGEYVAACLAGVFTLEEALSLVVARARLMQQAPGGAMLSVALPESEVEALLGAHLSLAAVNGPSL